MICKKRNCIWIFVICMFILSGCSNLSSNKDLNYLEQAENTGNAVNIEDIEISQLQKDMSFLTSDQCEGRRPGTLGNELVGEYIAGRFKEIGLQPLEEDYRIPYTKQTVSLVSDDITLEILDGDTRIDEFIYGTDFIEAFLNNADFSLPLVLGPLDKDCVVLTEDASKNVELSKNPSVKLIIQKSEKLSRGGEFYHDGFTPQLRVLPEVYSKLLEYTGKNVSFKAEIEEKPEEYKKYFQDNIKTEYIDGMVKLLLEVEEKHSE